MHAEFWIDELGSEEEYKKQIEKYSKTNEKIQAEKRLKEEAKRIKEEKLQEAVLEIERLKAEAYSKQTDLAVEKQERKNRKKNLPKIRELKKQLQTDDNALEANQKMLENKDFSMIPEEQIRKNIKQLKELGDSA